jgi:hypothetical protein
MKTSYAAVCVLFGAVFVVSATANAPGDEFKKKLFDRYDQKQLIFLPNRVVEALALNDDVGFGLRNFGIEYNHFYESVEIPKRVRDGESVDERTYVGVFAEPSSVRRVGPGEKVKATKFYVRRDRVFLELMSISATSFGRSSRTGGKVQPFGLEFKFWFPKSVLESGDYDTVVREINKYLLPVDEYRDVAEAAKKIEIQPGMSKDEVIKAMGEPLKTVVFGKKTILKYADVTIELEEDKVSELKAN